MSNKLEEDDRKVIDYDLADTSENLKGQYMDVCNKVNCIQLIF